VSDIKKLETIFCENFVKFAFITYERKKQKKSTQIKFFKNYQSLFYFTINN